MHDTDVHTWQPSFEVAEDRNTLVANAAAGYPEWQPSFEVAEDRNNTGRAATQTVDQWQPSFEVAEDRNLPDLCPDRVERVVAAILRGG